MMFKNLCFMVCASDINRLVNFYVDAFGFEQKYRWPADPAKTPNLSLMAASSGSSRRTALVATRASAFPTNHPPTCYA
jgi:uncharacterized glyoxalase superfamily protein PhnB